MVDKWSLSRPLPLLPLSLPMWALDVIGYPLNAIVDGALARLDLSESEDKTMLTEVVDPLWVPPKVNVSS